jgi:hypothetical protein
VKDFCNFKISDWAHKSREKELQKAVGVEKSINRLETVVVEWALGVSTGLVGSWIEEAIS